MVFQELTKRINLRDPNYPFILGINGIDASGKTYFANTLKSKLEQEDYYVCLINLDDFHNHLQKRREGNDENQAYIENVFNLHKLRDEIFTPIKRNWSISVFLQLLDLESDTYTIYRKYHVNNDTIVIVEGVLLFREPIIEFFDFRIFLDIDYEIMIERACMRDQGTDPKEVREKYLRKFIPIQQWYLKEYDVIAQSNLVIDNRDFTHPVILSSH